MRDTKIARRLLARTAVALMAIAAPALAADRTFNFTYAGAVTGLKPGQMARVWLPVPHDSPAQQVSKLQQTFPKPVIEASDASGNIMLYLEAPAAADGTIPFTATYRITRHEIASEPAKDVEDATYLKADQLVPVGGHPASLLENLSLPADPTQLARVLYDLIDGRMQYRKDQPGWGRGDASWACDSRFGNCTDFHSLFMSLARTKGLPAKFEIGFSVPEKDEPAAVAGYHCWAFFKPAGQDWVPVDISEANKHPEKRDYFFGHLDANRVTFSTGRDLVLSPPQAGPPVNFFIYPYAEVDGKPLPAEQIKRSFHFDPVKQ
ncbi:MAG: transglutaminase-like protein [Phycisphaerales bacterium]|nr:transglutaminase-like protein [Phycisphaerales bacterium]